MKTDYDNIKKVYSIWICMDVPKELRNTITKGHSLVGMLNTLFAEKMSI